MVRTKSLEDPVDYRISRERAALMSVRTPSYRLHKPSGQAVVTLNGHDHYLGQWQSPESRAEYDRLIAEWLANGRQLSARTGQGFLGGASINEVILAYWQYAQTYYRRPDGTSTSEADNIRLALRPLRQLYGHTPAAHFDSLALEALRAEMIREGHCRNRVNKDISRVKRLFRWAAARKLVPLSVHESLGTVEGLRAGRSAARETAPVRPVAEAVVEATLPCMRPQVVAMVRLQQLTGMRPGEVVVMRGIDLEMSGPVWRYRPGSDQGPHGQHKTAHRGQARVILIGPRAQEVLRPWLRLNLQEYLFQPREAVAQYRAELRRKRKSPLTPSQAQRRPKRNPKRAPGDHYRVTTYDHAVMDACDAAFPPPEPLARHQEETKKTWLARIGPDGLAEVEQWRKAHRWHPNQLRHAAATEIRREAGLDAARAVLGHRSPQITEVYAEIDVRKAAAVMEKLG
jgi:integrase